MQRSMLRTGKLEMFLLKKSSPSLVLVSHAFQLGFFVVVFEWWWCSFCFFFLKESNGVDLFTQSKINIHKSSVQMQ